MYNALVIAIIIHDYLQLQYLQIPSLNSSTLGLSISCCGKEFQILIASGKKELLQQSRWHCSWINLLLLPLVDEMFGLKIVDVIGISTCLFRILYNMIPLLQILLCCNVGQERFKRLVTPTEPCSLQTKQAMHMALYCFQLIYIFIIIGGPYNRCIL